MAIFYTDTASIDILTATSVTASSFTGSFVGNGSGLTGVAASAAPAGPNQSVQFNDSGATSGSSAFTYNKSTGNVNITGSMMISGSDPVTIRQTVVLGSGSITVGNPEELYVDTNNAQSINIATFKSNYNNYTQINIQNLSSGNSASADFVVTANNGSELGNYIDLGINNSGYVNNGNGIGIANDAYLYTTGSRLIIANATPTSSANSEIVFAVGGFANTYQRTMVIKNNYVNITGSLELNGEDTYNINAKIITSMQANYIL